jgi:drug/metabolite transporter (DMT)-like permease
MATTEHSAVTAPADTEHARSWLPLAAAGVTVLLWASAFVAIRSAGESYAPGPMALGRLLVATAVLGTLVGLRRRLTGDGGPTGRLLPRGRPLVLVLAYGALWFGAYTVTVNAAEQHLDAGTTALLVNVAPLLVAVAAVRVLAEPFSRALGAGMAVAFCGVVLIAVATSGGHADVLGVAFALVAAALYAGGVLLQKQALRTVDPLPATLLGCATGVVVCLPFAPELVRTLTAAPASATAQVIYLGIGPTAVAFSTWAYALARTSAGRLAASTYVVPALAVLLSWALLAETPAPLALAGGALCLAGVGVTRLPARRPAAG